MTRDHEAKTERGPAKQLWWNLVSRDDTSFRTLVGAHAAARTPVLDVKVSQAVAGPWLHGSFGTLHPKRQGWKLHVVETVLRAHETLSRVLPGLFAEAASFKVAATLVHLDHLNQAGGGSTQIGNSITVCPARDGRVGRLAIALDQATNCRKGSVPSGPRGFSGVGIIAI